MFQIFNSHKKRINFLLGFGNSIVATMDGSTGGEKYNAHICMLEWTLHMASDR